MAATASTVLWVITLICCWGAFGLGTAAVGSRYWLWKKELYSGLWQACADSNTCEFAGDTPALNAVRAFVIMGIVFGFIGTVTYSAGFFNRRGNTAARAGYGLIYLGALCWTVAMIVYSATYGYQSVAWGYAFAFGWACTGLLNIGGGFAHASVSLKDRDDDFD